MFGGYFCSFDWLVSLFFFLRIFWLSPVGPDPEWAPPYPQSGRSPDLNEIWKTIYEQEH